MPIFTSVTSRWFGGWEFLIVKVLAACGEDIAPSTETVSTQAVNIKVESNPNPVTMGDAELVFTITDAARNPIRGAPVDVSADHTDMLGIGMSGNWKLAVYFRKDGLDYKEDIDLTVE